MSTRSPAAFDPDGRTVVHHERLRVPTREATEFVDVTPLVAEVVRRSAVFHGLVTVQTLHTTTGIVVNEAEPLLIEDLKAMLRRQAPSDGGYRHDDMRVRTVNLIPGERANGHAHARALILGASESLAVVDGRMTLGRWQRVFFVELDGARTREVLVTVFGESARVAWSGRVAGRRLAYAGG